MKKVFPALSPCRPTRILVRGPPVVRQATTQGSRRVRQPAVAPQTGQGDAGVASRQGDGAAVTPVGARRPFSVVCWPLLALLWAASSCTIVIGGVVGPSNLHLGHCCEPGVATRLAALLALPTVGRAPLCY